MAGNYAHHARVLQEGQVLRLEYVLVVDLVPAGQAGPVWLHVCPLFWILESHPQQIGRQLLQDIEY